MDVGNTIHKQVDLMYDTVTKTLHTTDEKDMVVSALIYRTVYCLIIGYPKFTHASAIKVHYKM